MLSRESYAPKPGGAVATAQRGRQVLAAVQTANRGLEAAVGVATGEADKLQDVPDQELSAPRSSATARSGNSTVL